MNHLFNNDNTILEALRSGMPIQINAALRHLCLNEKLKGAIRQQLRILGGAEEDVREMLNQALVAFLNQVEENKYDPTRSAISTYLVKIAAQMYYTKRRSEHRRSAMHDRSMDVVQADIEMNPELEFNLQHQRAFLDKLLMMTGEKCRQLLQLHGHSYTMAEIAEKLQYKSPDSAKMAVHDCRKKLNNLLSERPELLKELREI
ncbi:MAG: hypothetical protein RL742_1791 [Bacteroidota bacterium]|jgi:RNA polymerase sigma factor (sigma-70 family)